MTCPPASSSPVALVHGTKLKLAGRHAQHHETADNNAETRFDFTEKNYERVAEIVANYPPNYKASAVIPLLDLAQQQNAGWISLAAMNRVAKILDMAEIRVYEVATFYSMYNRSKVGKYYIQVRRAPGAASLRISSPSTALSLCPMQRSALFARGLCHLCCVEWSSVCSHTAAAAAQVCGTTPCRLNGAQDIVAALEEHLGIHIGQTTADGVFTLGEMECMGCCVNAPMIVVADYSKGVEGYSYNYYEDLSPQDAIRIADTYRSGAPRASPCASPGLLARSRPARVSSQLLDRQCASARRQEAGQGGQPAPGQVRAQGSRVDGVREVEPLRGPHDAARQAAGPVLPRSPAAARRRAARAGELKGTASSAPNQDRITVHCAAGRLGKWHD